MFNFIKSLFTKKEKQVYYNGVKLVNKFNSSYSNQLVCNLQLESADGHLIGYIDFSISSMTLAGEKVKICHVNYSYVSNEYRGKGYGKQLYAAFAQMWHKDSDLNGAIIERHFISPVSMGLATWLIKSGQLPEFTWDERFVTCSEDYKDGMLNKNELIAS
jgi:GNAT superfamily N-acetyltransferase